MATYNNDYKQQEDQLLWEIHEIRHELSKEIFKQSVEELNKRNLSRWESLQKKYKKKEYV